MKQNNEELYDLIRTGIENNHEQAKEFIEKFDISACDFISEFQCSLLQKAISSNKYDIAKFLIEQNCNLDNVDDMGNTALTYLLSGYNNDNKNLYDEMIGMLLEKGVNIDLEDKHHNQALWVALLNAKIPLSIIKRLLDMGADPHHKNQVGKSPYDMVKNYNVPEINDLFSPYI